MLPAVACMILKNEGRNIEGTLFSIIEAFDKIVIVDTGSTDNTVNGIYCVMRTHPEISWVVSYHPWKDYADARNYSYSLIGTDKCLVTWWDGDDVPSKCLIEFIKLLKRELTPTDNIILGLSTVLRLNGFKAPTDYFDNGERLMTSDCYAGWCYPIHEQINFRGSLATPHSIPPSSGIYVYHPNSISSGKHLKFYEGLIAKGHTFCLHDMYFLLRELCLSNVMNSYWINFLNREFTREFTIRPQDQPIYYLQCLEVTHNSQPQWFYGEKMLKPLMKAIAAEAKLWLQGSESLSSLEQELNKESK